jgi:hypothetical protein
MMLQNLSMLVAGAVAALAAVAIDGFAKAPPQDTYAIAPVMAATTTPGVWRMNVRTGALELCGGLPTGEIVCKAQ